MKQGERAHMLKAIELSQHHMRHGAGGPFGAVIVRGNEVIAEGHNQVTSSNDPTAHAEVVAIRQACAKVGAFALPGCVIYTSCEPCPMCLSAIYWARLEAIFYANTRKDAAHIGFDDDHIYREFTLQIEDRSIPIVRMNLREAAAVFEEWENMPDKVVY